MPAASVTCFLCLFIDSHVMDSFYRHRKRTGTDRRSASRWLTRIRGCSHQTSWPNRTRLSDFNTEATREPLKPAWLLTERRVKSVPMVNTHTFLSPQLPPLLLLSSKHEIISPSISSLNHFSGTFLSSTLLTVSFTHSFILHARPYVRPSAFLYAPSCPVRTESWEEFHASASPATQSDSNNICGSLTCRASRLCINTQR